ncbi:MAG: universal stress protein [Thermoproteota archaeon]|jgi:nucleotide-binding universal stress UspA family protein|nr:universal stress protein [Thermoproteota archaeon]
MFSKLLAPVDGSDNSFRALKAAIYLAKKLEVKVTALHVMEKAPTVYIHPQKELEDLLREYRRQSEKILEKCEEIGNSEGVEISTTLIEGDVASSITRYGEKELFDIIIMGYRGSGRFKKMVLGSVSEKVLHQTKHSVLIVR